LACHNYLDTYHYFPPGTVPNTTLPPERRLSWTVLVWPAFLQGGITTTVDQNQAWDAVENSPPRFCVLVGFNDDPPNVREEPVNEWVWEFFCPARPVRIEPGGLRSTDYLGIAGVRDDAAELPLSDPRAGFFGYDRKLTVQELKDGSATTMMIAEGAGGGPWTAGGRATVRGLVPSQFAGSHRGLGMWTHPWVTNVAFADGSTHAFTASVSPRVFEALATVAGGEEVGPLEEARSPPAGDEQRVEERASPQGRDQHFCPERVSSSDNPLHARAAILPKPCCSVCPLDP
jgi:hypothetical protein